MNFHRENRLKNLVWTIRGDYEPFQWDAEENEEEAGPVRDAELYDAVKQGALARYFDREALSLYLLKKIYLGGEEGPLLRLAQLAADCGSARRLTEERAGVASLRRKAFDRMLDEQFSELVRDDVGRLTLLYLQQEQGGKAQGTRKLEEALGQLEALGEQGSTRRLLEVVDGLYNRLVDPRFEEKHGGLDQVLAVTWEELRELDWRKFLQEEALEEVLEQYQQQLDQQMGQLPSAGWRRTGNGGGKAAVVQVDPEALRKRQAYVELNFGPSCIPEQETKRLTRLLCQGAHQDCRLHFTEGILRHPLKMNYQVQYARKQRELNEIYYRRHRSLARRNIQVLAQLLRKTLVFRNEPEWETAEYGRMVPARLWKVGRAEPRRLFEKADRKNQEDFAVDILLDASGSQRKRQSQVALQGYIISEALRELGIPHRMQSFCSFWDTTVIHRFRDYEDGPEKSDRIFDFFTSSNNRDGLAIRAAAEGLLRRPEDGKVLIVLSDGRPNDRVIRRNGQKNPQVYGDAYAVQDTAHEVRKVRAGGVSVLGVFAGEEEDLAAERTIFGKDFAYIRDISVFSHTVGAFLRRLIEADAV